MGRKRKPKHLKRQPCTVSLPLDVHLHLDEISKSGLTISRYVEKLIRDNIEGKTKQTSLQRHVYSCPNPDCHRGHWHSPDSLVDFVWCSSCNTKAEYHGIYNEKEWGEDQDGGEEE